MKEPVDETQPFGPSASIAGRTTLRIAISICQSALGEEPENKLAIGKPIEGWEEMRRVLAAPDGLSTEAAWRPSARAPREEDRRAEVQTFDLEKPDGLLMFSLRPDPAQASTILRET